MKLLVTLISVTFLAGCSIITPVKRKFPDVPSTLTVGCPQLKKIGDDAKLSDISKTVSENYTSYYECAVKNDGWNEWYQIQKKIFEEVK